jgi:hypothetical protein
MTTQIQLKRGTTSQWGVTGTRLEEGEPGVNLDNMQFRIGGTGGTLWANSAIFTPGGGGGAGPTGPTGPSGGGGGGTGPTGPAGNGTAYTGPTGPGGGGTGATGPTGPAGNGTAYTGPTGPTGSGVTGATGFTGPAGNGTAYTGATGPTGADSTVTGPTGPAGNGTAYTGATGPTGSGVTGSTGPTGGSLLSGYIAATLPSSSVFGTIVTDTLSSNGLSSLNSINTTTITINFDSTKYPSTKVPIFLGTVHVYNTSNSSWEAQTLILNQSLSVSAVAVKWITNKWVMTFTIDATVYGSSGNDTSLTTPYGFVLGLLMIN